MPYKRKSKKRKARGKGKQNNRSNIPSQNGNSKVKFTDNQLKSIILNELSLKKRKYLSRSSQYNNDYPTNNTDTPTHSYGGPVSSSTITPTNTTISECRIPKKRYLIELSRQQEKEPEIKNLTLTNDFDKTTPASNATSYLAPTDISLDVVKQSSSNDDNSSVTTIPMQQYSSVCSITNSTPLTTINDEGFEINALNSSSQVVGTTDTNLTDNEQPVYIICNDNRNYSPISNASSPSPQLNEELFLNDSLIDSLHTPYSTSVHQNATNTLCTTSSQLLTYTNKESYCSYQFKKLLNIADVLKCSPTALETYNNISANDKYQNLQTTLTNLSYKAYTTKLIYDFMDIPYVLSPEQKNQLLYAGSNYETVDDTTYLQVEKHTSIKRNSSFVAYATRESSNSVCKSLVSMNLNRELNFESNDSHKYFSTALGVNTYNKSCYSETALSNSMYLHNTDFINLSNTPLSAASNFKNQLIDSSYLMYSAGMNYSLANNYQTSPMDLTTRALTPLYINSERIPAAQTTAFLPTPPEIYSNPYNQTYLATTIRNSVDNILAKPSTLPLYLNQRQEEVKTISTLKSTSLLTTNCNLTTMNEQSTSKDISFSDSSFLEFNKHPPINFTSPTAAFTSITDNSLRLLSDTTTDQNAVVVSSHAFRNHFASAADNYYYGTENTHP